MIIRFPKPRSVSGRSFEKLARLLLENREWVQLACASHDVRTIAWVMETAKELKVSPEKVAYQVLCGMAELLQKALVKAEVPVRVYTPLGEMIPGMAYLASRSTEKYLSFSQAMGASFSSALKATTSTR